MNPQVFRMLQTVLNMKGKELAELFDVSDETISRWRNGKQRIPKAVAIVMVDRASRAQQA